MLLKHLYALRVWLVAILSAVLLHGWGLFNLQKYLFSNVRPAPIELSLSLELQNPRPFAPSPIEVSTPQPSPKKPSKALSRSSAPIQSHASNTQNPTSRTTATAVSPESPEYPVSPALKMTTATPEPARTGAGVPVAAASLTSSAAQGAGNLNHNLSAGTAGVELPSSSANYLNNPKPRYPAASLRLEEQGRVIIHALIGADGLPLKMEVRVSSGFDRLDKAALDAVSGWRFTPGTRGGVAEAMWVDVPLVFKIN